MNLYLVSQIRSGYDEWHSMVVAAPDSETAQNMTPNGYDRDFWCPPDQVTVELIGTAKEGTEQGVILAAYNAG